jgi:hypothetical protein
MREQSKKKYFFCTAEEKDKVGKILAAPILIIQLLKLKCKYVAWLLDGSKGGTRRNLQALPKYLKKNIGTLN